MLNNHNINYNRNNNKYVIDNKISNTFNSNEVNNNINSEKYVSNTFEKVVLPITWILLCIYLLTPLYAFIHYRKRPQLEYRGVKITLLFSFSVTFYILLILVSNIYLILF